MDLSPAVFKTAAYADSAIAPAIGFYSKKGFRQANLVVGWTVGLSSLNCGFLFALVHECVRPFSGGSHRVAFLRLILSDYTVIF
jgi:hypothetical protein